MTGELFPTLKSVEVRQGLCWSWCHARLRYSILRDQLSGSRLSPVQVTARFVSLDTTLLLLQSWVLPARSLDCRFCAAGQKLLSEHLPDTFVLLFLRALQFKKQPAVNTEPMPGRDGLPEACRCTLRHELQQLKTPPRVQEPRP